jgi:5-formyltetrahydrofolate cyclo-ligase
MIFEEKQILRDRMRRLLRAMPPEEREAESARLRERLAAFEPWRRARRVLLFAALPSEPVLWPDAARGKESGLPKIEECGLQFYRVDPDDPLRAGVRGVAEPEGVPDRRMEAGEADVILAPGLAFDAMGRRLGRGGGFYDRLLGSLRGPLKVGICFSIQMIDAVPREAHDAGVDVLLTHAETRIVGAPDNR